MLKIDWGSLGEVFVVSIGVTVVVVAVFSLGVLAFGQASQASERAVAAGGAGRTPAVTLARTAGSLCFAICAAVIGYGIYLIIPASIR